jgi:hypothetical protein
VGMHESLQVEDVVVLVSFLTYLLQINGFQVFVEVPTYNRQCFVKAFVDHMTCFVEKMPCSG